ncbi:hypothetical protein ACWGTO_24120 [Mesorhizobium sp. PL10]
MVFSRNRFDAARLFSSSVAPLASEGRWSDIESDNPVAFFIQSARKSIRTWRRQAAQAPKIPFRIDELICGASFVVS